MPSEGTSITDKVKETFSSSTKKDDNQESSKPHIQDIMNQGPVIPASDNEMPPRASKEELKARAEALNK
ncbi:MAG: hypothetical protein M1834_005384 [Cirrosporium novae-zelandiae]|nr:MAG: hypothetical protein M1834_005384 [Cirrosporium novae-zelandiae]